MTDDSFDRDQAARVLWWYRAHPRGVDALEEALDRLAACVRPGAHLTSDEAGIAARGIREWLHQLDRYSPTLQYGPAAFRDDATALADRLEKAAGR